MTTESAEPTPQPVEKKSYVQKLWVPIVLLIGLFVGEIISAAETASQPQGFEFGIGPGGYIYFHRIPPDPAFGYHVVLTTISVALLIALVLIYTRMYVETKANFALGLVVVLVALLIQAMLSYPLFEDLFYTPLVGPGISSPVADVVAICAYTVFLYLSLE